MGKDKTAVYQGFEQGPIRPPSEADSLLLRLTRNCPWNLCTFCRVYKNRRFSLRPADDIRRDIDLIHAYVQGISSSFKPGEILIHERVSQLFKTFKYQDRVAFNAAMNWYGSGMESIFLQDANSLVMKPKELIEILMYIRTCFPHVKRITTYARSHTLVRIKEDELEQMARAGLNRIHVGMETGSDKVLAMIKKGVDKQTHIKAGLRVKQAGMELSEYVMPGLGGIDLSIEHALETASALNRIDPDFIRLRTLAVTHGTDLAEQVMMGTFEKPTDAMMAKEIRVFLEGLNGIQSKIKSDHILNLFETIEGKLPEDKKKMIQVIDDFFQLPLKDQVLYQVGRRMGVFRGPEDMDNSPHMDRVKEVCRRYKVTPDNVDQIVDELMKRFV